MGGRKFLLSAPYSPIAITALDSAALRSFRFYSSSSSSSLIRNDLRNFRS
jgi:hypothetical protein